MKKAPPSPPPDNPTAPAARKSGRIKRTYHLHVPLVLFCFVSLLIAIGAFNSNNNLLFWLFSLALSMLLVSGVISGQMLMGIRVERERVQPVHAGEPLRIRYRVSTRNRFVPVFALTITEEPGPRESFDALLGPDAVPEGFVAHVGAGATVIGESDAPTRSRGLLRLHAIRVTSEFPFGIVKKSLLFIQPGAALVRPALIESSSSILQSPSALARRQEQAARAQSAGQGDHFLALREYSPGDSPRMVAWRASARLDGDAGGVDLLVRQQAAAPGAIVWIVADLASASTDADYERAIGQTAWLATHASSRRDESAPRVGVWIPAAGLCIVPSQSSTRSASLLDDLALLPAFALRADRAPAVSDPPPSLRGAELILVNGKDPPGKAQHADVVALCAPKPRPA